MTTDAGDPWLNAATDLETTVGCSTLGPKNADIPNLTVDQVHVIVTALLAEGWHRHGAAYGDAPCGEQLSTECDAIDTDIHGPWDKASERYEDGCRAGATHPLTTLDQERDKWASALFGVDIEAERRKRHLTPGAHTKPQPAPHDAYAEAARVLRASAASPETIHRILTQILSESEPDGTR